MQAICRCLGAVGNCFYFCVHEISHHPLFLYWRYSAHHAGNALFKETGYYSRGSLSYQKIVQRPRRTKSLY